MSDKCLRINEVIEFDAGTPSARAERVLFIDATGRSVLMIEIFGSGSKEHWVNFEAVWNALAVGTAKSVIDPYEYLMLPDSDYSEARRAEKRMRVEAMSLLTKAEPELKFNPNKRGELIRKICAEDRTDAPRLNKGSVYILWRRFLQRGQLDNAFLGDHDRAGWTTEMRSDRSHDAKLGRDRVGDTQAEARAGVVLTHDLKQTMFAIATTYHEQPVNGVFLTWPKACELGREQFFNKNVTVNEDGVAIYEMPEQSTMPSDAQIKREYYRRKHFGEIVQAQSSVKSFNLNLRPLKEDQRQIAYGAMDVQQADFDFLPIYVVNPVTRKVIGKPTLAGIRDTMCRARTASALTWETDSAAAALLAIENLVSNKVEYGNSLRVTIEPSWMPYEDLGDALLTDNGGFITKCALQLWDGLRLELMHTGNCRPEMKPIVESSFKSLYDDLIKLLPGAVPPDAGDPDSDPVAKRAWERARLDITQLRRLIFCYDVSYNRFHYLKDYPLADDMKGTVRPIPNELYHFSNRKRTGRPRHTSLDVVRLHCLTRDIATVTREGIVYRGKTYISQRAIDEHWQEKVARLKHFWDIEVLADPRTAARIYHLLPGHARLLAERLPFLEPCWRTRSLRERTDVDFADIEHEQRRQKAEYNRAQEGAPQQAAWLNGYVNDTVQQATQGTEAALGCKKQKRTDFRENCRQAREQERDENVHAPKITSNVPDLQETVQEEALENMTASEQARLIALMSGDSKGCS
ncbi:hypothetical protein [Occallatibacter riparius]|uniref:Integrase catalytic domain-containing protein n=1 Tax=Occallatibacter riparius TaxID=1002689 RepID=A0A9J7BVW5_9BACT|nr:hypothetical protein [Occallatibacter riparius]UWZ85149.1 hypothetical protein MOP44_04200 [Occallatibacter riparius]